MDTAINIKADITVSEDGSWSYTWSWSYAGDSIRAAVYEELLIETSQGLLLGGQKEAQHTAEPGQTYLGGGNGQGKPNPGDNVWSLKVFTDTGEMLGLGGGSFFAMIPLQK